MTDQEKRKKIIALIQAHTRETIETREKARAWLIREGIYTEEGELEEGYGGEPKEAPADA